MLLRTKTSQKNKQGGVYQKILGNIEVMIFLFIHVRKIIT
ncbi:hypothetical protein HMPREF9554_02842 [Treponema phagedenis F0421]|nr:hypothetical protein HMPREF9554_02842 [Treponema phagedenis F0421]